jgi:hypothetical protein
MKQVSKLRLSIKVRPRKRERVLDQFNPWPVVSDNNDFHDIEAKEDIGIVQHSQPGKRAARNALPLLSIDCCKRPSKVFPGARFYFDEYQPVVISADDVDLAATAPFEVTVENLVAVTPQESTCQFLAAPAAPEMN